MSDLYGVLIAPFVDFTFMKRALVACLAISIGSGPIGMLLMLRRMSLMGDALSHAVLPGAAVGFLFGGLWLPAMSAGGMVAGLVVALLAGAVTRLTPLKEDANFAAFYLISLAAGVLIVSIRGSSIDLMHVLFGTILAVDAWSLVQVAAIATLTLAALAVVWRPLVAECVDPGFLRALGVGGGLYHLLFLALVVLNLVAGFQALGTLMALGLMILPAAAARFWVRDLLALMVVAALIAFASSYLGLLASFHWGLPSGPTIILVAGFAYLASVIGGRRGSLSASAWPGRHLEA